MYVRMSTATPACTVYAWRTESSEGDQEQGTWNDTWKKCPKGLEMETCLPVLWLPLKHMNWLQWLTGSCHSWSCTSPCCQYVLNTGETWVKEWWNMLQKTLVLQQNYCTPSAVQNWYHQGEKRKMLRCWSPFTQVLYLNLNEHLRIFLFPNLYSTSTQVPFWL